MWGFRVGWRGSKRVLSWLVSEARQVGFGAGQSRGAGWGLIYLREAWGWKRYLMLATALLKLCVTVLQISTSSPATNEQVRVSLPGSYCDVLGWGGTERHARAMKGSVEVLGLGLWVVGAAARLQRITTARRRSGLLV